MSEPTPPTPPARRPETREPIETRAPGETRPAARRAGVPDAAKWMLVLFLSLVVGGLLAEAAGSVWGAQAAAAAMFATALGGTTFGSLRFGERHRPMLRSVEMGAAVALVVLLLLIALPYGVRRARGRPATAAASVVGERARAGVRRQAARYSRPFQATRRPRATAPSTIQSSTAAPSGKARAYAGDSPIAA